MPRFTDQKAKDFPPGVDNMYNDIIKMIASIPCEPIMKANPPMFSLLLVDDEPQFLSFLKRTFSHDPYEIYVAGNGLEAMEVIEAIQVDAMVVDLAMPKMDGLDLLAKVQEKRPEIMTLMITGSGGIHDAVQAMKMGAVDFLEKPFEPQTLRVRVGQLHRMWQLKQENQKLKSDMERKFRYERLVGNSTAMLRVKEMIARVGSHEGPVLIEGETGTGKELVARAVHQHSTRCTKDFVPVDCAAVNPSLIESELFGHVKGAFTGAHTSRIGLIRSASQGCIFLDEIGELPNALQAKLLRTIQEREVRPVGSNRSHRVDIRVISATNRDLSEEVSQGRFREDLFYRIGVFHIKVPPLRQRKEDIPLLARYFLKTLNPGFLDIDDVSAEALAYMENYEWPGNVRQLENVMRRAIAVGKGPVIYPEDLPSEIVSPRRSNHWNDGVPEDDTLGAWEKAAITQALTKTNGNRLRAAEILGIGQATVYRKIKEYQIGV